MLPATSEESNATAKKGSAEEGFETTVFTLWNVSTF
jgi:hypothetical protein